MTNYTKEVSEQIGAREADTDILVTKTNIWETADTISTIWTDNKIIQEQEDE